MSMRTGRLCSSSASQVAQRPHYCLHMADARTDWQRHIGVGEPQPRDSIVTDGTRTHTTQVMHDVTGKVGGAITEHRSGRVDSLVKAQRNKETTAP